MIVAKRRGVQPFTSRSVFAAAIVISFALGATPLLRPSTARAQRDAPADQSLSNPPAALYLPDGQLQSGLIRVYVNRQVAADAQPQLLLLGAHAVTAATEAEKTPFDAAFIAPDQRWMDDEGGVKREQHGTLLLFDLSGSLPVPWYKAMTRLTPILRWGEDHLVIASRAINVGNPVAGWIWAVFVTAIAVGLIAYLTLQHGPINWIIQSEDGHLALSKAQIAAWTIAIGTVVTFYGLVRLRVPEIPSSLVWLMGMSLATGGLPYLAPEGTVAGTTLPGRCRRAQTPRLADLVTDFTDPDTPQPSIARAQMLFWTLVLIVVFVTKSALDGELWDVPLPLVTLMGLSQAGYVTPKFLPAVKGGASPPDQNVEGDLPENRAARAGTPGID